MLMGCSSCVARILKVPRWELFDAAVLHAASLIWRGFAAKLMERIAVTESWLSKGRMEEPWTGVIY